MLYYGIMSQLQNTKIIRNYDWQSLAESQGHLIVHQEFAPKCKRQVASIAVSEGIPYLSGN